MLNDKKLYVVYEEIRRECIFRYAPHQNGLQMDIFPKILDICEKLIKKNTKIKSFEMKNHNLSCDKRIITKCIQKSYVDLYDNPIDNYFIHNQALFDFHSNYLNPYDNLKRFSENVVNLKVEDDFCLESFLDELLLLIKRNYNTEYLRLKMQNLLKKYHLMFVI